MNEIFADGRGFGCLGCTFAKVLAVVEEIFCQGGYSVNGDVFTGWIDSLPGMINCLLQYTQTIQCLEELKFITIQNNNREIYCKQ